MTVSIKSEQDIEKMRIAGRLTAEVLEFMEDKVVPGVSTEALDRLCHDYITQTQQAIPAPLNYRGFPKSICTSINHQVCHGIPGPKKLKTGDIVNIDVTVIKDKFHGDSSKMFYVGKPSVKAKRLTDVTQHALWTGIAMVKPGTRLGDIGHAIQTLSEGAGYSVVREYCGHGIGRVFHEDPQVLHYGKVGSGMVLEEGMTFTIEPMLNAGRKEVKVLSDGWTVVTRDRALSAQWEHTLLVTHDGVNVLTLRAEEQALYEQYLGGR